jgi:hypothetical protein
LIQENNNIFLTPDQLSKSKKKKHNLVIYVLFKRLFFAKTSSKPIKQRASKLFKETKISNLCTKNSEPVLLEAKRTNQANLIELFRVC